MLRNTSLEAVVCKWPSLQAGGDSKWVCRYFKESRFVKNKTKRIGYRMGNRWQYVMQRRRGASKSA